MKTASQSEGISKHAAHESSRRLDQATRSNTATPGAKAASVIHRASETFRRTRPMIRPFIGLLFSGALGALAVGLVSHFAVVVPLEKNLLSAEARSLATELDSAVRIRSSLISIAAGNSELDGFLESGGFDKMLTALRKQFPDFLSLEVTGDRGQVQAMGGELPLSQASLFSKDSSGKTSPVNLGIQHNKGFFHDDPENNCYFITCKHIGPEGGKWFTRSRFSRQSLAAILKSIPTRRVTLVPITGASNDIPEGPVSLSMPQSCVVRTIGGWWRGPAGAEALLTMPGWLMRMEDSAARPIWRRAPIALPLCLVLCTLLASIILKQARLRDDYDGDIAAEPAVAQSPIQDEKRGLDGEFCESSASLAESSGGIALPVGKSDSISRSEAEHGQPAARAESFESASRADLPCVTKLVTIPASKSTIEIPDTVGQEPWSDCSEEPGRLPDTLEVCWCEPCEHCETEQPPCAEGHEGATALSDEEKNPGSERSSAGGHPLSISG